jgi:hypothetical protein
MDKPLDEIGEGADKPPAKANGKRSPAFPLLQWFKGDFDHVLVAVLSVFGALLLVVHLAYERPARRTAMEAVELLKQKRATGAGIDKSRRDIGDEIAIETAVIDALAGDTRYSALREGVLHLGLACLVSAAVIITVESVSRRRFRSEVRTSRKRIARDVWKAIFERDVPRKIVDEVRSILSEKVVKEDCRYTITLLPPYEGMSPGSMVVRRDLAYNLRNISFGIVDHPVTAIVSKTLAVTSPDGKGVTLPRLLELKVNGEVKTTQSQELAAPYHEDKYIITLEPGAQALIEVSGEEAYMVEGGEADYIQLTLVIGMTVVVVNQYSSKIEAVSVRFSHPNWNQIKQAPAGTYSYRGGVLPGQGFIVNWKFKDASLSGGQTSPEGKGALGPAAATPGSGGTSGPAAAPLEGSSA